jgi:hypothetical protein
MENDYLDGCQRGKGQQGMSRIGAFNLTYWAILTHLARSPELPVSTTIVHF